MPQNFECNGTKFAPNKALKLITYGKLTFYEKVVPHRVVGIRAKGSGVGI